MWLLRNREAFSLCPTFSDVHEDVEEEQTQLHAMEQVGVACRKVEHPDSACVADIQSHLFPWDLLLITAPEQYGGVRERERERSHVAWWRITYSSFVRGEMSGDGWEHKILAQCWNAEHFSHKWPSWPFVLSGFVVVSCVQPWPIIPQSSGRITFVASLLVFVAAQLWGLGAAASPPYMLRGPWAEWHTCLPGFCVCVYGSGQNIIVELLPQLPHRVAYVQSSTGPWGEQWSYCFRHTLILGCPPRPLSSHWASRHIYSAAAHFSECEVGTPWNWLSLELKHVSYLSHRAAHAPSWCTAQYCSPSRWCLLTDNEEQFKMIFCMEVKHYEHLWLNFSCHYFSYMLSATHLFTEKSPLLCSISL